jgi:hypothetical protein
METDQTDRERICAHIKGLLLQLKGHLAARRSERIQQSDQEATRIAQAPSITPKNE